jgi:hypothetical protein
MAIPEKKPYERLSDYLERTLPAELEAGKSRGKATADIIAKFNEEPPKEMFAPFIWGYANNAPSSGGGDADADAYLAAVIAAGGTTDATIDAAVQTLFTDLKTADVYSKLIAFYPIIGGVQTSHAINGNLNATYDLTYSGTWTHSSLGQVIASNSGQYASLNYIIPAGTAAGAAQNFSCGVYVNTNTDTFSGFEIDMGVRDNAGAGSINYRLVVGWSATGDSYYYAGDLANQVVQSPRGGAGMYVGTRTSNAAKLIFNGSTINSSTVSQNGSSQYSITLGAEFNGTSGNVPSSKRQTFGFISEYLTDAEVADLYDAVQTCQVSLSRQA